MLVLKIKKIIIPELNHKIDNFMLVLQEAK